MQRRKFIRTAAAGAAAVAVPKWLLGQTCEPTTPDLYGYTIRLYQGGWV